MRFLSCRHEDGRRLAELLASRIGGRITNDQERMGWGFWRTWKVVANRHVLAWECHVNHRFAHLWVNNFTQPLGERIGVAINGPSRVMAYVVPLGGAFETLTLPVFSNPAFCDLDRSRALCREMETDVPALGLGRGEYLQVSSDQLALYLRRPTPELLARRVEILTRIFHRLRTAAG